MQRLLLLSLLSAALLPASGCRTGGAPERGPDASVTDASPPDASPVDGGGQVDVGVIDAGPSEVFVFGRNETGKSTPSFFHPLADGGELHVELGPQGLWMVVLAFKTRGMFAPPLKLAGRVMMAGNKLGELKLAKQRLLSGGDGFDYYYNFFLVVAPDGVAGQAATIEFEIEDSVGRKHSLEHPVVLSGGT